MPQMSELQSACGACDAHTEPAIKLSQKTGVILCDSYCGGYGITCGNLRTCDHPLHLHSELI